MKKVTVQVNIPSEMLITVNMFKEFVTVHARVITNDNSFLVLFDSMEFRGCMAFNIKPEMHIKFIDMLEDRCMKEYASLYEPSSYEMSLI